MAERAGRSGARRCARFPDPPGWPGGQNRTQSAALLSSVRVGAPAALLSRGARSQGACTPPLLHLSLPARWPRPGRLPGWGERL